MDKNLYLIFLIEMVPAMILILLGGPMIIAGFLTAIVGDHLFLPLFLFFIVILCGLFIWVTWIIHINFKKGKYGSDERVEKIQGKAGYNSLMITSWLLLILYFLAPTIKSNEIDTGLVFFIILNFSILTYILNFKYFSKKEM